MTRSEFVQQAVLSLVRAGITQQHAIDEADLLANALARSGKAPWSEDEAISSEHGTRECSNYTPNDRMPDKRECDALLAVEKAARSLQEIFGYNGAYWAVRGASASANALSGALAMLDKLRAPPVVVATETFGGKYTRPCPRCGVLLNEQGEEPENTMDLGHPIKHTTYACNEHRTRLYGFVPADPEHAGNPAGRGVSSPHDVARDVVGAADPIEPHRPDCSLVSSPMPLSGLCTECGRRISLPRPKTDRRAFSVSVYLQTMNCVFLVKHKRLNLWLPISGEHQGNETPLETAKRKVREETGWNPKAFAWTSQKTCLKGPAGLLGYEEHTAGDGGLHMNFVFTARVLGSGLGSEPISYGSWSSYAWNCPTRTPVPVPPNVAEVLNLLGQIPATKA